MIITSTQTKATLATDFTPIIALLEQRLQHGEALSEFELMRWLQAPEQAIFQPEALSDSLSLFRSHFILMHCLYQLKQRWHDTRSATLTISALHIQRHPWTHTPCQALQSPDPMAAYYLNLQELNTSQDTVDELLAAFWKKMRLNNTRNDDFRTLELSPPVTIREIQLQYRRLVMRYHPDRGGDNIRFCQIQTAYQRIKNDYL